MTWSAAQYVKFEDDRTRPVRDLLAAVPAGGASRVVDLGCGPGNSTEVLAARFPGAVVSALDSSEDMVRAARARLPGIAVGLADVSAWDGDGGGWDVILSNAVLQWVPDHAGLLPRLAGMLAPGGSLAVQMPDNLDQPSHTLMARVASDGPWAAALAPAASARTGMGDAGWYYALLRRHCARVDVWRTTYHHVLDGPDAVVEWFKGSGLRPYLAPLDAADRAEFLRRYRDAVAAAYPAQPDGSVLLAFPRLFIVATR